MKLLLALAMTILAFSAMAASVEGQYKASKEVMSYTGDEEECESSKGKWLLDEQVCVFKSEDSAELKRTKGILTLSISTVGSNLHSCQFDGSATINGSTITARAKGEEYSSEVDSIITTECVVTAKVSKKGKMSVSTNSHCQSFCGANAWLEVDLQKIK